MQWYNSINKFTKRCLCGQIENILLQPFSHCWRLEQQQVHGLQSLQQLKNTNIKLSETQYINGVEQQQKLSSKNDH